jgi:hypothetical protein
MDHFKAENICGMIRTGKIGPEKFFHLGSRLFDESYAVIASSNLKKVPV